MDRPSSSSHFADRVGVTVRPSGDGHVADVTVQGPPTTTHRVRVSRVERERYGGSRVPALVKRAFEFLLAREKETPLLRAFGLSPLERAFPPHARDVRAG